VRFPIRYSPGRGWMLRIVGLPQRWSYVDVRDDTFEVRMGWGFWATCRRADVQSATRQDFRRAVISTGVHGWRGRWLVNGAGAPITSITFTQPQRAFVMGFPIRLRELLVSVDDPESLIAALG
jgi:hypothetical protein